MIKSLSLAEFIHLFHSRNGNEKRQEFVDKIRKENPLERTIIMFQDYELMQITDKEYYLNRAEYGVAPEYPHIEISK